MKNSVKTFLLELESEKNDEFVYIKADTIDRIIDIDFNKKDDYIKLDFVTTYKKKYSFAAKLSDFKKWLIKQEKSTNLFKNYLKDFFDSSSEIKAKEITEIIDDTNEIMSDQDCPSNAINRMVGANQTMDLEKIFKRSMPKSVRNYSGNLGLGTVVW